MQTAFDQWQTWAFLSAAFAALTAVLAKVGIERVDPTFATFIRTMVIVIVAGLFVVATNAAQPLNSITSRSYIFLVLSGVATGLSWLCYFRALKMGPVAQVASIDKLSVVFVAIFAALFLGDHLSLKHWLGVALVGGGAIMLASA
ncbi:MAG: EamA family transporter [Alphaproteobacteria bacterium]|nr:EamA family transporter [Alphaproteobacteria bacterium]